MEVIHTHPEELGIKFNFLKLANIDSVTMKLQKGYLTLL